MTWDRNKSIYYAMNESEINADTVPHITITVDEYHAIKDAFLSCPYKTVLEVPEFPEDMTHDEMDDFDLTILDPLRDWDLMSACIITHFEDPSRTTIHDTQSEAYRLAKELFKQHGDNAHQELERLQIDAGKKLQAILLKMKDGDRSEETLSALKDCERHTIDVLSRVRDVELSQS